MGSPFDNELTLPTIGDEFQQSYDSNLDNSDFHDLGSLFDNFDFDNRLSQELLEVKGSDDHFGEAVRLLDEYPELLAQTMQGQDCPHALRVVEAPSQASMSAIQDYGFVNSTAHMSAATGVHGLQRPILQPPPSNSINTQHPTYYHTDHPASHHADCNNRQPAFTSHYHTDYPTGIYVNHDNRQVFYPPQQHYDMSQASSAAPSPDLTMTSSSVNTPATPPTPDASAQSASNVATSPNTNTNNTTSTTVWKATLSGITITEAQSIVIQRKALKVANDDLNTVKQNQTAWIKRFLAAYDVPYEVPSTSLALSKQHAIRRLQLSEYNNSMNHIRAHGAHSDYVEARMVNLFFALVDVHKGGLGPHKIGTASTDPGLKASSRAAAIEGALQRKCGIRHDVIRGLRINELVANPVAAEGKKFSNGGINSKRGAKLAKFKGHVLTEQELMRGENDGGGDGAEESVQGEQGEESVQGEEGEEGEESEESEEAEE